MRSAPNDRPSARTRVTRPGGDDTKPIAVTGACGFVGSAIVRRLADAGNSVLAVDLPGRLGQNLRGVPGVELIEHDRFMESLRDPGFDRQIDALVHQAACTDTQASRDLVVRVNVELSRTLLERALALSVPFVYASSASVYGNDAGRDEEACAEHPLTPYAWSKAVFDDLVREHLRANPTGSPVTGLRYFNVYGPREAHKGPMASMVTQCRRQVERTGQVRLFGAYGGYGPGDQVRDYVHVDDVARVVEWMLAHRQSGIYNVGSGAQTSFNSLAGLVMTAMGVPVEIAYVDMPVSLHGRYQHTTRASLARLRAAGCDVGLRAVERGVADVLGPLRNQPRSSTELGEH